MREEKGGEGGDYPLISLTTPRMGGSIPRYKEKKNYPQRYTARKEKGRRRSNKKKKYSGGKENRIGCFHKTKKAA